MLKQTLHTIVPHTLEEAYEVADAVEKSNMTELKNELGDLLYSILIYSDMAEETSLLMLDALSYPLPFAQKGVYSKEFSVAVNPQVAKSMGFSLKTDSEIKHHILSLETKDHPHG